MFIGCIGFIGFRVVHEVVVFWRESMVRQR